MSSRTVGCGRRTASCQRPRGTTKPLRVSVPRTLDEHGRPDPAVGGATHSGFSVVFYNADGVFPCKHWRWTGGPSSNDFRQQGVPYRIAPIWLPTSSRFLLTDIGRLPPPLLCFPSVDVQGDEKSGEHEFDAEMGQALRSRRGRQAGGDVPSHAGDEGRERLGRPSGGRWEFVFDDHHPLIVNKAVVMNNFSTLDLT